MILEYIKVDGEIQERSKEVSKLRARKKELDRILTVVMQQKGLAQITTTDESNNPNQIVMLEKESKVTLNNKTLQSILVHYFGGDHSKALEAVEFIEENRPTQIKTNLKRNYFKT